MDDKVFDLISKIYSDMQEMKATMTTDLQEIKEQMATKEDISAARRGIVKLENNVMDKIDALFDAREVQIDR